MGIGHRLVATLGFVVPAALAAWIAFGVDAQAAPPDLRPMASGPSGAFRVEGALLRPCEPAFVGQLVCDCARRIEVVVGPATVEAAAYEYGWELRRLAALTVARDERGWDALRRWFTAQRAEPIFDGRHDFRLVARDGVAYRDVVRAIEIADRAGFTAPQLVSPRGAEIDRPGPLRVTITAAGVGADFLGAHAAHLPLVGGAGAWRALAAWLAARQADPRLAANDLEIEIVATLDARPRDVALAQRAIERAGYEAWYPPPRWVSALPPPPTEVTR